MNIYMQLKNVISHSQMYKLWQLVRISIAHQGNQFTFIAMVTPYLLKKSFRSQLFMLDFYSIPVLDEISSCNQCSITEVLVFAANISSKQLSKKTTLSPISADIPKIEPYKYVWNVVLKWLSCRQQFITAFEQCN